MEKTCRKCAETKPLEKFNVDKSRADGRHPYCTKCKTAPYAKPGRWDTCRQEAKTRQIKTCLTCKEPKSLAEFHRQKRNLDGRHSHCKTCANATRMEYYDPEKNHETWLKHRDVRLRKTRERREARKLELLQFLGGKCVDCPLVPGNEWPAACFDFHHTQDDKERTVGHILMNKDWELVKREASKCVVLCASCHRRRHARELSENDTEVTGSVS